MTDKLFEEYMIEFNKAKAAFRDCRINGNESLEIGLAHMKKADEINLKRLALI